MIALHLLILALFYCTSHCITKDYQRSRIKSLADFVLEFAAVAQGDFIPKKRNHSQLRSSSYAVYSSCPMEQPICNAQYKYRSYDGSCNNLINPTWGMRKTWFNRLLPAKYRDGLSLQRTSVQGNPLPSARKISITFFPDRNNEDRGASLMAMSWAQFMTHDIAASINLESKPVDCCNPLNMNDESVCLSITVPTNDPFYSKYNVTCLNMTRSPAEIRTNCGPALQQINYHSHIIDGSHVYGPYKKLASLLRENHGGRLLVSKLGSADFLLIAKHRESNDSSVSYETGDFRANQNPPLTALHTLFVREHNRIAKQLERLRPTWNDERLFQEGRSIVVAMLQHITYNEWLPMILGSAYVRDRGLLSSPMRQFAYHDTVPPVVLNSFTSAAFRVGHSGIQGTTKMYDDYNKCPMGNFTINSLMNKPGIVQENQNFEAFLRGLTQQPMQVWDNHYTEEITQRLFQDRNPYGMDLLSLDLQRGRDHGLPPYVEFLQLCSGFKPKQFDELKSIIPERSIAQLQEVYGDVNDIDLFTGGNLEKPAPGARVGPTFQCIIGEQFYQLKYGDRFWYEIRGQPHSFTNRQLYEIKKVTLARLICDNSNIQEVPINSFHQVSDSNVPVNCQNILSMHLSTWL